MPLERKAGVVKASLSLMGREENSYAISDDGTRIAAAFFDKNAHESKIVVMNAATGEQMSTQI